VYITSLLSSLHIHPINRGQTGFVNSSEELDKIGEGLEPKKKHPTERKIIFQVAAFLGFHGANFPGCFLQIFGLSTVKKKSHPILQPHVHVTMAHTSHIFSRVCFFCLVLLREDPIPTLYLYQMQNALEKCRDL